MAFELVRGGPCPNCGAPIEFASAAAAAQVCTSCSFVVARTDRDLRAIGRVGDLVAIKSPFAVGQSGTFEGKRFLIAGRVQYDRTSGPSAPWEELYLELLGGEGDEGWMWLAHAQGQWIVTTLFPGPIVLPSFEAAIPGAEVNVPGAGPFQVAERGKRRAISAEGALPFAIDPSETERFADLSGQGGQFGTIDFGEGASSSQIYFGRVIDPSALVLEGGAALPAAAPAAALAALECPACGGNLPLAVPDLAERVVCRYCNMACDVNAGALVALKRVPVPSVEPLIALGSRGRLRGRDVTLIGFMVRATTIDGETYRWREYLLYAGSRGFVWLVEEDDRWEHLVPIAPGDVESVSATTRIYKGVRYNRTQEVSAVVESVVGEFYWKVEAGETVEATEFAGLKQRKISEERTPQEITTSLGTPLPFAELRKAFAGAEQRLPAGEAASSSSSSTFWIWLSVIFLGLATVDFASSRRELLLEYDARPPDPSAAPASKEGDAGAIDPTATFSEPFEIKRGGKNMEMTLSASGLQNSWTGAEIALVNLDTGTVLEDSVELSYYSGVEDGAAWSEGDREKSLWYSRLPEGRYVVRIEHTAETPGTNPPVIHLRLVSDKPSLVYFLAASLGLLISWLFRGRSRKKES